MSLCRKDSDKVMARLDDKRTLIELSNLKERLAILTRCHKLLKDKQDERMRQFISLIRENNELRSEVEDELTKSMRAFVVAKSLLNESFIDELFAIPNTSVTLDIQEKNIMSVIVPQMDFMVDEAKKEPEMQYGFLNSNSELDQARSEERRVGK